MSANIIRRDVGEIDNIKIHGRHSRASKYTLFWSRSGVEMNVNGSELWVHLDCGYSNNEPWIVVYVNGALVSRLCLKNGENDICVFRNMNPQNVKNIRIFRDSQPFSEQQNYITVTAVSADGEFFPVENAKYNFEFVGDSITSGEGSVGVPSEGDWIPMWISSFNTYSVMVSDAFGAECRLISQCGWGVRSSWDNVPQQSIPPYYEQVCGVINGQRDIELGAHEPYDFGDFRTDAVIINLGTNDSGAMNREGFKSADGTVFKQIRGDGKYISAVKDFIKTVRRNNPTAHILWTLGLLKASTVGETRQAVEEYIKESGDKNVGFLEIRPTEGDELGSRQHPGVKAHRRAADEIIKYLKGVLNEKNI